MRIVTVLSPAVCTNTLLFTQCEVSRWKNRTEEMTEMNLRLYMISTSPIFLNSYLIACFPLRRFAHSLLPTNIYTLKYKVVSKMVSG